MLPATAFSNIFLLALLFCQCKIVLLNYLYFSTIL
nr:MAG TPA: hypothetical protein [Caudoviricetes sp.]